MTELKKCKQDVDIWIDFETGQYRRLISINKSFKDLGQSTCLSLPFFHAFTGCDSTSSFYMKSKTHWFHHWQSHPMKSTISAAFQQLGRLPTPHTVDSNLAIIERFVLDCYGLKDE